MTRTITELADDVWCGRAHVSAIGAMPTDRLEEVAPGTFMSPGFGHAFAINHDLGLTLFDTGSRFTADALHRGIRRWSTSPVTHAVFSHGHLDHVGGIRPFDEEAARENRGRPVVIAHENVLARFDRYGLTRGYNTIVNQRQFRNPAIQRPDTHRKPDVTFSDTFPLEVGGKVLELTHYLGETDDHVVGWLPDTKVLFPGDLFLWVAPNAGNPQKVQRYPLEWAQALRSMASLNAETMLGSHGVPVFGRARIREALENTARYLEAIVEQTLDAMNAGATLLDAVHGVRVPSDLAECPYLQPVYDEPEFIVHNVWRRYGGWYDGDPAHLKPATASTLAAELASLCGGVGELANRALDLLAQGDLRLAGHLAQFAVQAAPNDASAHRARDAVYTARSDIERSTMAKGIFAWTAAESRAAFSGTDAMGELAQFGGDVAPLF